MSAERLVEVLHVLVGPRRVPREALAATVDPGRPLEELQYRGIDALTVRLRELCEPPREFLWDIAKGDLLCHDIMTLPS